MGRPGLERLAMRRSIKLASDESRVLSLAAKAAGRSLDDFLVYTHIAIARVHALALPPTNDCSLCVRPFFTSLSC